MIRLCSLTFLAFLISACSVYTSEGRKAFESQAPEHLDFALQPHEEAKDSTCWLQPADEALWQIMTETRMTVRQISENQIEVCLTE